VTTTARRGRTHGGSLHRTAPMNPVHVGGGNRRIGPVVFLESRTSTRSDVRATSRHELPLPLLAVLLRHAVLGLGIGAGKSWLCSTLAPFGLNQPRIEPLSVYVITINRNPTVLARSTADSTNINIRLSRAYRHPTLGSDPRVDVDSPLGWRGGYPVAISWTV
jgi:hypothetical protein